MASEYAVLAELELGGPANVGALSARLKAGPSKVTRVLARLKVKGKVTTRAENGVVVWEKV